MSMLGCREKFHKRGGREGRPGGVVNMDSNMLVTLTVEDLRNIVREEVTEAVRHIEAKRELPYFLTRSEMAELLRISPSKSYELLGRTDFPVCREFGVKIYTDKLFDWVELNMPGYQEKPGKIRSIS